MGLRRTDIANKDAQWPFDAHDDAVRNTRDRQRLRMRTASPRQRGRLPRLKIRRALPRQCGRLRRPKKLRTRFANEDAQWPFDARDVATRDATLFNFSPLCCSRRTQHDDIATQGATRKTFRVCAARARGAARRGSGAARALATPKDVAGRTASRPPLPACKFGGVDSLPAPISGANIKFAGAGGARAAASAFTVP